MPLLSSGSVRYYDRFRNHVASAMGNQAEGPSDFWLRAVLRESTSDDCILDSVLAIGALVYARDQSTSPRPLFLTQLSRGTDQHYHEAIKHYTRALGKLRKRIADSSPGQLSRTILINTVLFSFFEAIQGNTASSDSLTAHGIVLLKDTMLRESRPGQPSSIAAAADDEGVLEAEFYLVRTATWNIQYSPMYPRQQQSILEIPYEKPHLLPIPLPTHTPEEFWKMWWHAVTLASIWNARAQAEITGRKSEPYLSSTSRREHGILLSRVEAWRAEALRRMSLKRGLQAGRQPVMVYAGARALHTAAYCAVDPSGALFDQYKDDCLELLSFHQQAQNHDTSTFARSIIYDGMLSGVSQLAQRARIREVRFGALEVWKKMVNRQSSWDIKSIFMGTSALIAAEEEHRDDEGYIPLDARYDWTQGSWNDAYTEFQVILTPKFAGVNPRIVEKNLKLRPAAFGFV